MEINELAVVVAGVAMMAVGFIWYAPKVFGNAWLAEIGRTPEEAQESFGPAMIVWTVIGSIAGALALAIVIGWSGATDWLDGLLIGLFVGIGFFLVNNSIRDMYEGRSSRLSMITSVENIVAMAVAGTILGGWM